MTAIDTTAAELEPRAFGSFLARLRAMLLDAVCIATAVVGIFILLAITSEVPGSGRIGVVALLALLLLYEPVTVALYGGTIGHRWCNLRVVDERTGDNPTVARAALRFFLKSVLGVMSFTTMALTRRHQAVHDRLTRTTVQIRDLHLASPEDIRWERDYSEESELPSRSRRIAVIIAYLLGVLLVMAFGQLPLLSEGCMVYDRCTSAEELTSTAVGLAWMAASIGCIIAGWRGKLWGARSRSHAPPTDLSGTA